MAGIILIYPLMGGLGAGFATLLFRPSILTMGKLLLAEMGIVTGISLLLKILESNDNDRSVQAFRVNVIFFVLGTAFVITQALGMTF